MCNCGGSGLGLAARAGAEYTAARIRRRTGGVHLKYVGLRRGESARQRPCHPAHSGANVLRMLFDNCRRRATRCFVLLPKPAQFHRMARFAYEFHRPVNIEDVSSDAEVIRRILV